MLLFLHYLLSSPFFVYGMHADEAGINDFVVRTAGHGQVGVRYSSPLSLAGVGGEERIWITSQSNEYPPAVSDGNRINKGDKLRGAAPLIGGMVDFDGDDSTCSIAARNVTSGVVLWRVNACSSARRVSHSLSELDYSPRHATLASSASKAVYSFDDQGVLRGWNAKDGGLLFDVDVFAKANREKDSSQMSVPDGLPRLMSAQYDSISGVKTVLGTVISDGRDGEALVLHHATSGQVIVEKSSGEPSLSAKSLLQKAKVSSSRKLGHERARIVDVVSLGGTSSLRMALLVCWSATSNDIPHIRGSKATRTVSSFSSMAWVELQLSYSDNAAETEGLYGNEESRWGDADSNNGPQLVYQVVNSMPFRVDSGSVSSSPLLLSTARLVYSRSNPEKVAMIAVSANTSQLLVVTNVKCSTGKATGGNIVEIDVLHPYWRFISTIHVQDDSNNSDPNAPHIVRIAGIDDRYPDPRRIESLFLLADNAITNNSSGDFDDNENKHVFRRVYGPSKSDEEIQYDTLAYCPSMGMVVAALEDKQGITGTETNVKTFQVNQQEVKQKSRRITWVSEPLDGDAVILPVSRGGTSGGLTQYAHLIDCSTDFTTVAFSTQGGLTVAVRLSSLKSTPLSISKLWLEEEALGSISSAIFLDKTKPIDRPTGNDVGPGNADEEEEMALRNLEFSNRIRSQIASFKNFFFGGGILSSLASVALVSDERKMERDFAFGFAKVSVLLSNTMHRIIALDTAEKGRVLWSMNLNLEASWHKIIHGGQFVSLNDPHGNGGVHDHEMLALSFIPSSRESDDGSTMSMEWKCFDGTSGRVFSENTVPFTSHVVQIVPLRSAAYHPHETKSCRQVALLIHADDTVSVVPDTPRSYAVVHEASSAEGKTGLFVHTIDNLTGMFRSFRITRKTTSDLNPESNPFRLQTVGSTYFDPSQEKIVNVAYPRRGEVVQSPSTVLGDDALLLKYLNPHLVVVVTEATKSLLSEITQTNEGGGDTANAFYNALVGNEGDGTSSRQRKPLGATKPGSEVPSTVSSVNSSPPSLFISLVDSVSGQILHRVSHFHANESDLINGASSCVPVVISENWIVYAFFNQRTRRTDVGVLTLHEGMIDKNGITAFSAPEQELIFSSLESAKPVVLSKTFTIAKAVTALGVTTTKAGISSKQFAVATGNNQVISIDRRMLDPRRPSGDLKESEKMEGLIRYSPLLPIIPMRTPSHTYEVSSVKSIVSASANVESQSLLLAFGGPDIFFTRLAPSKGFDLLPDDFNRGLLTVVLFGLIILLVMMQRMNTKKTISTVWS